MNIKFIETNLYIPVSITNFYGANYLAAKYIGLNSVDNIIYRYWQHGWITNRGQNHPDVVASEPILEKNSLILVARKNEEEFLSQLGYKSKAIGLPFCYVPEGNYNRDSSSLLVMPAHGTRDLLINVNDDYNDFLKFVVHQKEHFKDVRICMHQEDINLGYHKKWEEEGFSIIRGAAIDDTSALIRMHALFSQFTTILSDSMGSHIVYAAASGAKIAMREPIGYHYDISKNQFYQEDTSRKGSAENFWKIDYGFLFCNPVDAENHIEWGKEQIGFDNRLSPSELKNTLGWSSPRREYELLMYNGKRVINKIRRMADSFISTRNS
jgi:hypothetical protein